VLQCLRGTCSCMISVELHGSVIPHVSVSTPASRELAMLRFLPYKASKASGPSLSSDSHVIRTAQKVEGGDAP
jgi:hypothetical protein